MSDQIDTAHVKGLAVRDLMSHDLAVVESKETTRRLMELMTDHHVAAIPVVENGNCIGIVTTTDLLKLVRETNEALHSEYPHYEDCLWAVDLARRKLDETPAEDLMSVQCVRIAASARVSEAARKMHEQSIHHLAVFEGDDFVGVLSTHDLLRALC